MSGAPIQPATRKGPISAAATSATDPTSVGPITLPTAQVTAQQFQAFQESLPKVNQLAFQLLLNEIIPLSMSVQKKLNDAEINGDKYGKNDVDETTDNMKENLNISPQLDMPSYKLIHEISQTNGEEREKVLKRLRNIGFQIGSKLSDLLLFSNNPNIQFKDMDILLIMKFICRDVWKQVYGKQIDNLKTNHRGTFYLFDFDYKPIQSFSINGEANESEELEKELKLVEPFLEIPVGIIKGVLTSLGYESDDTVCMASFVDRPSDKSKIAFPKAVSFHIQVLSQQ